VFEDLMRPNMNAEEASMIPIEGHINEIVRTMAA
jgi:hypothetical protein